MSNKLLTVPKFEVDLLDKRLHRDEHVELKVHVEDRGNSYLLDLKPSNYDLLIEVSKGSVEIKQLDGNGRDSQDIKLATLNKNATVFVMQPKPLEQALGVVRHGIVAPRWRSARAGADVSPPSGEQYVRETIYIQGRHTYEVRNDEEHDIWVNVEAELADKDGHRHAERVNLRVPPHSSVSSSINTNLSVSYNTPGVRMVEARTTISGDASDWAFRDTSFSVNDRSRN